MRCCGLLVPRLRTTALAAAAVGAAACSCGSSGSFATPNTMPPNPPTTSAAPAAQDPAAFPESQAGAGAFIRAFFDAYRAAFATGRTSDARAFIDPSCSCFPVLDDIDEHAHRDEHYVGVSVQFGGLDVQLGRDQALALYYTSSSGGTVLSASGSTVAIVDSGPQAVLSMELRWRGRWWITDVRKS